MIFPIKADFLANWHTVLSLDQPTKRPDLNEIAFD